MTGLFEGDGADYFNVKEYDTISYIQDDKTFNKVEKLFGEGSGNTGIMGSY